MLTHVNFNHVNKIEATYKVWRLNVKFSEVLLLRLRATFHALPLFYLRTLILRTYARKTTRHWKSTLRSIVSVKVEPRSTSRLSSALFILPLMCVTKNASVKINHFHCRAIFPCERRGSTFTFTRDLDCLYFIYARSHVKITRQ